ELLARTHGALRASKDLGKNRISSGDAVGIGNGVAEAREMLARGEGLRAVSQPIVALDGELEVAREYLARGPRGAFEMPSDFFRICHESDLLTAVDLSCLRTCLAADDSSSGRAHVNLFPSTLLETRASRLLALFPESRPRNRYVVEISEQQILGDPAYLRESVGALRDAGLRIAVDDVGFGRSSLESLVVLEPDLVKIDRAYASGISRSAEKERSLRRLVRVAATLGAEISAEGVESREDLGLLREIGVAYAQGYVFGRPE
ncbi:MAG TPA: EAL domain-containing protein, partial [Planctomycetota bacterium]|nr:EAL domain-containing protein [Planctomycetota bacterium]